MVPSRAESPTVGRRSPGGAPPDVSARFWALLEAEPLRTADALDVGTGAGRLALALAPRCRHVVGIDRDAGALQEGRRRAAAASLANVEFLEVDAEARDDYVGIASSVAHPTLIVAHLCMSEAIIAASARTLAPGQALAFVALHVDQWRETGRRSRFAYDEDQARRELAAQGFVVEHLEVEQGLAAAIGLAEKWRSDGRWFHYIKFLEDGGRTLTRSHLIAKARRR